MTPSEHYDAGRLTEAISAATEAVKKHPTDAARRGFLVELLCFAGQLERTDKHLEAIGQQEPQAMVGVSLFRQLIRAEIARQQFFFDGRLPEFLAEPSPVLRLHLEASICLREDRPTDAAKKLAEAEEQRPRVCGVCDGAEFDDLRDLDDLTAPIFEVLTSTGKYYWIPIEQVELIEFHAPESPRDLLWRRAQMTVNDGPDGEVFLPTLYPNTYTSDDDQLRLGRGTDWIESDGELARGVGLRMFLIGDEDKEILGLNQIEFRRDS